MGSGTRWPIGHMKGPATGPLQEKKREWAQRKKKERKKAQRASLVEINISSKIHRPKKRQNGASLISPYRSSKVTSMGEGDSDLIEEQNEPNLSSNGRNNMGEEQNKSMK